MWYVNGTDGGDAREALKKKKKEKRKKTRGSYHNLLKVGGGFFHTRGVAVANDGASLCLHVRDGQLFVDAESHA